MTKSFYFFKEKWGKLKPDLKQNLVFLFLVPALLLSSSVAIALEPPDAGEIARLKQTGEYSARLEQAKALGNHLIDPDLLDNALYRAQREALMQRGFPSDALLPAPPLSWKLMPTTGNVKVFALLIDFNDYPASNTQAGINSSLFGDGSLIPSNASPYESLASYYLRSSYNQLDLRSGVTLGWYRPSYNRASMAQTVTARENLIKEAITYFNGLGQNFSQFDNDGDGKIEYFIVIWTGPDNGWANFWWGYQTTFTDQTFTVNGKTLGKYSWQWEYKNGTAYTGPFSPRTAIHETGHGLGLPDYYDYDATVGPDGGVGGLDMMDANWGDHNSFSKWVLEWITPAVVASGSQSLTLDPSGTSQDAVLIMPGATSSDAFREFFIAQNRYRAGNDGNAGYPTDGMLIWHVDARLNTAGTDYAYDNSYTSHKLLKLMQADGLDRIENHSVWADAAMYYEPGNILGPLSNPSSRDYMGVDTRVNVTGLSQSGQQMSATFSIDATSTLATLDVLKSGAGSGTVTSSPAGISCGNDCAESYGPPATIILTATPTPGSAFMGWSGGGCSGTGNCTVSLSSDTTVTAAFISTLLLNEDFDPQSSNPPAGWTQVINAGSAYWWFTYDIYNTSGGTGECALGATYAAGPFDAELRTSVMDLSAYNSVGLEFRTSIEDPYSTADVDVSVNGSSGPWTNVWQRAGMFIGPQTVNIDLSKAAAGHNNVMIRFHHYGTGIWWVLDDVKVMAAPTSTVTATASGNGSGSVSSDTGGINYSYPSNNSGSTTALDYGTSVTLTASAAAGSTVEWTTCTGTASGNGSTTATCSYTSLDGNKTAAATFTSAPPTSPDAPTGLTASPANPIRIDLGWTDNSNNETSFELQRVVGSCGATAWATIATPAFDVTSYQNTGLIPNTVYSYRVRAINQFGNSAWSNCANVATPALETPGSLVVETLSANSLGVTWVDTQYETGYQMQRRSGGCPTPDVAAGWQSFTPFPPANATYNQSNFLSANTTYGFRMRAVQGAQVSAYTACVPGTTFTTATQVPAKPSNLVATALGEAGTVNLTWTDNQPDLAASSEVFFILQRKSTAGGTTCNNTGWTTVSSIIPTNTISYQDNGAAPAGEYFYRLRAMNSAGQSAAVCSNAVTVP